MQQIEILKIKHILKVLFRSTSLTKTAKPIEINRPKRIYTTNVDINL